MWKLMNMKNTVIIIVLIGVTISLLITKNMYWFLLGCLVSISGSVWSSNSVKESVELCMLLSGVQMFANWLIFFVNAKSKVSWLIEMVNAFLLISLSCFFMIVSCVMSYAIKSKLVKIVEKEKDV